MRYFYDLEFLEDGFVIELISIGIVAEDGREYYAVSADMPLHGIQNHEWLMENVVPHLPMTDHKRGDRVIDVTLDLSHPDVKHQDQIAREVEEFIRGEDVELWGWYSAYDHVGMMQLWGPMMARPDHLPMFTHDLKQEASRAGVPDLPSMPGVTEHHALQDARELQWRHALLTSGNAFILKKDKP